jgi:hypothetical protein
MSRVTNTGYHSPFSFFLLSAAVDDVFPRVMSRDGYGVAEHLVFPLSAWVGLFTVVVLAELQVGEREREKHVYVIHIQRSDSHVHY